MQARSNDGSTYVPLTLPSHRHYFRRHVLWFSCCDCYLSLPQLISPEDFYLYYKSRYSEGTSGLTIPVFLYMALFSGDRTSRTVSAAKFMKIIGSGDSYDRCPLHVHYCPSCYLLHYNGIHFQVQILSSSPVVIRLATLVFRLRGVQLIKTDVCPSSEEEKEMIRLRSGKILAQR